MLNIHFIFFFIWIKFSLNAISCILIIEEINLQLKLHVYIYIPLHIIIVSPKLW